LRQFRKKLLMQSVALKLKDLRNRSAPRVTVRAMAEALEMPPSTYAAYEDPNKFKKLILPFDLAKRIAAVLESRGVPKSEVMALAGLELHEAEGIPIGSGEMLIVSASVAAGVWREHAEWPEEDRYPLEVSPPPFKGAERFAMRMDGYSMDLTIPPGSDLECLRVAFGVVEPVAGDLVIVERHNHDLVEMTCKRLDKDGDDWILRMESSKPEFQDIIRLGHPSRDLFTDQETRVIGIVLKSHQNHFRRRT